jgi:hypothetical protein
MPSKKLPKSWPKITQKLDNLTKISWTKAGQKMVKRGTKAGHAKGIMLVKNWSEVTRKLDTRNVCRVGRKGDGASTSLLSSREARRHPKLRRTMLAELSHISDAPYLETTLELLGCGVVG